MGRLLPARNSMAIKGVVAPESQGERRRERGR